MDGQQYPATLDIRVFGDNDSTVDAEVLARILHGTQRVIYLAAMDKCNCDCSLGYVPKDIRKYYVVQCSVPRQGSYALSLTIGNGDSPLAEHNSHGVANSFVRCLGSVAENNFTDLTNAIIHKNYRAQILDTFRSMLPKPGANWKFGVTYRQQPEVCLSPENSIHVLALKEKLRQHRDEFQTITGSLQAMDFAERKITILLPVSNRFLECFYDESLEIELLETRRDFVQVTGKVVVDAQDFPVKILDVENIQPIDLSDFEVKEVHTSTITLEFLTPLTLTPTLSETRQYLCLQDDALDIDVMAPTREELLSELHEQIIMLWHEYALADDSMLTPSAQELKKTLLEHIKEKKNG